jgi:UDP-N-acetylmuramoyl-L-alanyl-D-glutamate--2,6-diaminopimelate ligase
MNPRRIVKAFIPKKLFKKIEPWGHLGEAVVFNTINGFPGRGMKVIGVTGTNGKTTTSFMIHKMLNQSGVKTGIMTTVGWGVDEKIIPQVQHYTNVPMPVLMKRLKQMKDAGTEWLVLETTSQALVQHRTWGIPYSVAVMTNVTHEHLDYHGTFENYRNAKRKLFKRANRNKKGLRTGIINAEDPAAELFKSDIANSITYGVKSGDLRASQVKMTASGSSYKAMIWQDSYNIVCHIPGSFNVYNSLAVIAVGRTLGLDQKQIEQGIDALKGVEGRMNTIDAGQPFEVIVDYAHTPDSFEKLFKDLKPMVKGKMIVMFGSAGGQRDSAKRPIQGALAGKYCDEVILTEEDDRNTPGMDILNEIAAGAEKSGKTRDKNLFLVHDRTEAIKFTLGRAKAGDTVLLLGKGHEKNIERAHGLDDWDEVATARKAIKSSMSL